MVTFTSLPAVTVLYSPDATGVPSTVTVASPPTTFIVTLKFSSAQARETMDIIATIHKLNLITL